MCVPCVCVSVQLLSPGPLPRTLSMSPLHRLGSSLGSFRRQHSTRGPGGAASAGDAAAAANEHNSGGTGSAGLERSCSSRTAARSLQFSHREDGGGAEGQAGGGPGAAVASGGWVRQLKVLCVFALLLWLMIDQVLLRWEVNRLHQLQEVAGCGCNPLPSTSTELLQGAVESLLSGAEMRQGAVGSLLSSAELPEA